MFYFGPDTKTSHSSFFEGFCENMYAFDPCPLSHIGKLTTPKICYCSAHSPKSQLASEYAIFKQLKSDSIKYQQPQVRPHCHSVREFIISADIRFSSYRQCHNTIKSSLFYGKRLLYFWEYRINNNSIFNIFFAPSI